jgi:hypothetical protein
MSGVAGIGELDYTEKYRFIIVKNNKTWKAPECVM